MVYTDIISGFLGAGKTTFIKSMINRLYNGLKVVIIENEFGEIGVDASFLKETGIEIKEMSNGCICCSLVGDFEKALVEVIDDIKPDRIIIEPSGVGKLSDVMAAVSKVDSSKLELSRIITVVDAKKCKMYAKNFGEFFDNQIAFAKIVVLSRVKDASESTIKECVEILHGINPEVAIITTDWEALDSNILTRAFEDSKIRMDELMKEAVELHLEHDHAHHHGEECGHDHHHHHHGEECGHDHDHHHGEECGHDHHHHHGEECEHNHHHHHGEECGHNHHHHHGEECGHDHHHHHADEVFDSIGFETKLILSREKLESILRELSKTIDEPEKYGRVLRSKGIVECESGRWLHFDLVPFEYEIREGSADFTSRICVIGSEINKEEIERLFGLE